MPQPSNNSNNSNSSSSSSNTKTDDDYDTGTIRITTTRRKKTVSSLVVIFGLLLTSSLFGTTVVVVNACGVSSNWEGVEFFVDCDPVVLKTAAATPSSSNNTTKKEYVFTRAIKSSIQDPLSLHQPYESEGSSLSLADKNYYMLDMIRTSLNAHTNHVDIIAGGCPDHKYFHHVDRTTNSSASSAIITATLPIETATGTKGDAVCNTEEGTCSSRSSSSTTMCDTTASIRAAGNTNNNCNTRTACGNCDAVTMEGNLFHHDCNSIVDANDSSCGIATCDACGISPADYTECSGNCDVDVKEEAPCNIITNGSSNNHEYDADPQMMMTSSILEMKLQPCQITQLLEQQREGEEILHQYQLQNAMLTSLMVSLTVPAGDSTLPPIADIDVILLPNMVTPNIDDNGTCLVQFQVVVTFMEDDDSSTEIPSPFDLDTQIIKTFSDPSQQSLFFFYLNLTDGGDLLKDVRTVNVSIIKSSNCDSKSTTNVGYNCGGCGGCSSSRCCGCGHQCDMKLSMPQQPVCPSSTNGMIDWVDDNGGGGCSAAAKCGTSCGTCGTGLTTTKCGTCGSAKTCGTCYTTLATTCGNSCSTNKACGSSTCGMKTCGYGCSNNTCGLTSSSSYNTSSSHGSGCAAKTTAASISKSPIPSLYTPTFHHSIFSIPNPTTVASTPILPLSQAITYSDDEPIGVAVNGIVFSNHTVSKIFDSCMGHVDGNGCHSYHYHLIPICLLENLGQNMTGINNTYWKADDPNENLEGWPMKSDPSPILGFAMDGIPIMGPYDDEGELQIGVSAGSRATLDDCNGKFSLKTGQYSYYMTPNPPYSVACFRGGLGLGTFEDRAIYGNAICPISGIESGYYNEDAATTDDSNFVEEFTKTLFETKEECLVCTNSYFLFQSCPSLSGRRWQVYSLTFGILFLVLCTIPSMVLLFDFRYHQKLPILNNLVMVLIFSIIASLSTALFMLIDPHYTRQILPPILVGILYGLRYPCINSAMVLLILCLHDLISATEKFRRVREFLPKTRYIFFSITFGEFGVQIIADIFRGLGHTWDFLLICQYFFIGWGILLSLGLAIFATLLLKKLSAWQRKASALFFSCVYGCCISVFVYTMLSIYALFIGVIDDGEGNTKYYSYMIIMRCVEIITISFFIASTYAGSPLAQKLVRLPSSVLRSTTRSITKRISSHKSSGESSLFVRRSSWQSSSGTFSIFSRRSSHSTKSVKSNSLDSNKLARSYSLDSNELDMDLNLPTENPPPSVRDSSFSGPVRKGSLASSLRDSSSSQKKRPSFVRFSLDPSCTTTTSMMIPGGEIKK